MSLDISARRVYRALVLAFAAFLATSCASPPLNLYTLEPPDTVARVTPSAGRVKVVEIRRAAVPDFLDNQDILVRRGSTLVRSSQGRWASRLSLGATHFVAGQLARRRPDILITDQPQIEPPDYQVFLTISTLDVTAGGSATMEADWLIVPRNTAQPSQRKRGAFTATGSTATDQGVVSLNTALLQQLADAIGASSPW
jgi:uncharacterized lipoprotein YmbA